MADDGTCTIRHQFQCSNGIIDACYYDHEVKNDTWYMYTHSEINSNAINIQPMPGATITPWSTKGCFCKFRYQLKCLNLMMIGQSVRQ